MLDTKRLDLFVRRSAAHPYNDGTSGKRIGQIPQTSYGKSGKGVEFQSLVLRAVTCGAAMGFRSAPIASIHESN